MSIDRSGLKASLQEQYTRNSKGTLSLVVEQVRVCGRVSINDHVYMQRY